MFNTLLKPKFWLLVISISLITVVLLEGTAYLVFEPLTGKAFDYHTLKKQRRERLTFIRNKLKQEEQNSIYILHPYVGYTGRPGNVSPPFNNFGMPSPHTYPYQKQENDFVIGVLGGSVAGMFAKIGQQHLIHELRALNPFFKDKQVTLLSLATGGYKEPQQLFHLVYCLLSGVKFDLILNIDGFNDLALTISNIEDQINPLFPSGFHTGLMSKAFNNQLDRKTAQRIVDLYDLYGKEYGLLEKLEKSGLRGSAFLNLLGVRWSQKIQNQLHHLDYAMAKDLLGSMTEEFRGPEIALKGNSYEFAAQLWKQTSEMIAAISQHYQIPYIHVLQPNQYVDGSKPLSENEQKIAYQANYRWGQIAKEGYPYLIEAGKRLRAQGIAFYDLTQVFKNISEDIYLDVCCHFGNRGNIIMGKDIAKMIHQSLLDSPALSAQ